MCHTVEALADFHALQSSASVDGVPAASQMQDAHVCAQPTAQNPLFQSKNKYSLSPALSTSEGFFLQHFFFLFPLLSSSMYEISKNSCIWDEAKTSQPTGLAANIFTHLYVQPVISPSKQGRTQPWWSESSNVLNLAVMWCWITLAICYLDSHRSASQYWADT